MIKIRKRKLTLDELLVKIDAAGIKTGSVEYKNNYGEGFDSAFTVYTLIIFVPKLRILQKYILTIRIIFRRKIQKPYLFDNADLLISHPSEVLSLQLQDNIKYLLCQSIFGKIPILYQKHQIYQLITASERFNFEMSRYGGRNARK